MSIFRRKVPNHFIPIDPNNTGNKDWLILLEAGTIVGPSRRKLRVARSTQERKVVRKYNVFFKAAHYLDVEGYDPRIHAVYFCPQLYRHGSDRELIPLEGEEIGRLIAQALESGIKDRHPWYLPSDDLPAEPMIDTSADPGFETLVVDLPQRHPIAEAA